MEYTNWSGFIKYFVVECKLKFKQKCLFILKAENIMYNIS